MGINSRCRECGRPFDYSPYGEFCSEGCQQKFKAREREEAKRKAEILSANKAREKSKYESTFADGIKKSHRIKGLIYAALEVGIIGSIITMNLYNEGDPMAFLAGFITAVLVVSGWFFPKPFYKIAGFIKARNFK